MCAKEKEIRRVLVVVEREEVLMVVPSLNGDR